MLDVLSQDNEVIPFSEGKISDLLQKQSDILLCNIPSNKVAPLSGTVQGWGLINARLVPLYFLTRVKERNAKHSNSIRVIPKYFRRFTSLLWPSCPR
jgi:hypothetical protein